MRDQLDSYITLVDERIKCDDDQPTIGLLVCRDTNNIGVEFALRDMSKPMGMSEYTLPDNLKGALPTVEEIERDLQLLQAGQTGNDDQTDGMKKSSPASGRDAGGTTDD